MLRVAGISKGFPGVQALDSIDFDVAAGEVHALVGENGAGKSTLVKILGGGLLPDSGTITLDGEPLELGDPLRARASGIGIIYQELTLVPELNVAENIFLGRELGRGGLLDRRSMEAEAAELMGRLGIQIDPRTTAGSLSVGVRQLVEVARALGTSSRLLIFDEPSATLTDQELRHLFKTIGELRASGLAIIYISHRLEEIFEIADRVTVFRDGKRVATAAVSEVDRAQLIRWMVGRELEALEVPAGRPPGEPLLEVDHLSCPPFFTDVSFTVRAGEIVGLAGLVGAGRTSVALSIFGVRPPVSGSIVLSGAPARFRHPWDALERGVGYLTEDRKDHGIFAELSVAENIDISNLRDYRRGLLLSASRRRSAARAACARFDVRTTSIDKPIRDLSGGNQQKALLARLLARPLRILILDEPTRGVDVGARAEVHKIVRSLADDGVGVLLISSELPEILEVCDRVVVLREGRSMGTLDRAEATQERIMDLATAEVER